MQIDMFKLEAERSLTSYLIDMENATESQKIRARTRADGIICLLAETKIFTIDETAQWQSKFIAQMLKRTK